MKMGEQHIVPLSRQAVAILRELQALTGGVAVCVSVAPESGASDVRQYDQCRAAANGLCGR
jgi:hypothetical protein